MADPPDRSRPRPPFEELLGPDAGDLSHEQAEELLRRVPFEAPYGDAHIDAMVARVLARDIVARTRRRRRRMALTATAAVLIVGLVVVVGAAFRAHRWNGRNSTETLSYEESFDVLFDPARSFDNRRAAQMRIHRYLQDALDLVQALSTDPAVAAQIDELWSQLTKQVDDTSPPPYVTAPPGVLAQLLHEAADSSLAASQRQLAVQRLAASLSAGIDALRELRQEGGSMLQYSDLLLGRLRDRLRR